MIFGTLYALSVIALYALLSHFGMPTFYDKLMAVPLLNLLIKVIDRVAESSLVRRLDPAAVARGLTGRRRNLAYMTIWAVVFLTMSSLQAVGDTHRGQWVPFWMEACFDGRPHGCRQAAVLTSSYCRAGSGWACNEYGMLIQPDRRPEAAAPVFQQGCDLGFETACANLNPTLAANPRRAPPDERDYRIVLRGRKGTVQHLTPPELHRRACTQGYADGCQQACSEGDAWACGQLPDVAR
jgi:hypothetical protein